MELGLEHGLGRRTLVVVCHGMDQRKIIQTPLVDFQRPLPSLLKTVPERI